MTLARLLILSYASKWSRDAEVVCIQYPQLTSVILIFWHLNFYTALILIIFALATCTTLFCLRFLGQWNMWHVVFLNSLVTYSNSVVRWLDWSSGKVRYSLRWAFSRDENMLVGSLGSISPKQSFKAYISCFLTNGLHVVPCNSCMTQEFTLCIYWRPTWRNGTTCN